MDEFLVSLQIRDSQEQRGSTTNAASTTSSVLAKEDLGLEIAHGSPQLWLADRLRKSSDESNLRTSHTWSRTTTADELETEKERFLLKQISQLQKDKIKLEKQLEHAIESSEEKNKAIQQVQDENIQLELERQIMEDKWTAAQSHLLDLEREHKQLEMRWVDRVNADSAIYMATITRNASTKSSTKSSGQTAQLYVGAENEKLDNQQPSKASVFSIFSNPLKSSAFRGVGRKLGNDI